jgi:hypothetical protein
VSRASRIEKELRTLAALDREYEALLRDALRSCAGGYLGMFGQNDAVLEGAGYARLSSQEAIELLELGTRIAQHRADLVLEEYPLHARFLAYRSLHGANVPGEATLAATFLRELDACSSSDRSTASPE